MRTMSLRKSPSDKQILVGGPALYEARCKGCWADGLQEWPIGPVVGKRS
jgi:thymidine kinase